MKQFTDQYGRQESSELRSHQRFIKDMESKQIPWRWYSGRGMYGAITPAVVSDDEWTDQDLIRATNVPLARDSMGLEVILYVPTGITPKER
jgi:hypothetical protein